jgi:hypothetical protein
METKSVLWSLAVCRRLTFGGVRVENPFQTTDERLDNAPASYYLSSVYDTDPIPINGILGVPVSASFRYGGCTSEIQAPVLFSFR